MARSRRTRLPMMYYAFLNAQWEQTWHNRHVNHSQLETKIGLTASSFPSKTCTSRLILPSRDMSREWSSRSAVLFGRSRE